MVLLTKYTIVHHITSNIAKFIQQSRDLFSFCFEIKYQVVPFMRGVNFISEWVVVSSPTGPACLFDSSPQSVNMPVYDRIGFKKKIVYG